MKYLYKTGLCIALMTMISSCVYESLEFDVDKPLSVAAQEEINAYNPLSDYSPDGLYLGAGVAMSEYIGQGVPYRLINSNFNAITLSSGISHGDIVQADGSVASEGVEDFLGLATDAGLSVYGSPLIWHANQNAEFLNSTIAPVIIPAEGGPAWDVVTEADFETDDASNYESNGPNAELSFTADGQGAGEEGRALVITNSAVRENDWESQLFLTFEGVTQVGETYRLTMDVRADETATMATQAQTAPGAYKHWNFFGAIEATPEWNTITVEITITEETSECNTIAFNLGTVATNYYFDNLEVALFNENAGGPTWDLLSGADFETEDASNYESNGPNAELSFTANGAGADGSGRALVVSNTAVRDNDWESQLFFTFGEPTAVGQQLQLTMDVRADATATMATQAQTAPGAYKHWNFFGAINATTEWTSVSVQITVTEETSECNTIAFNLGATATNYYFDNIEVRWYNEDGGGEQVIEKTPEEKIDTLSIELEKWIAGILTASSESIHAWDVVKDPMDEANPASVQTSEGKELGPTEFYWQDYLGKDYGLVAFNLARKYAKDGDLLFISESNIESNLEKCQGLIDYVAYLEDKGAIVDGISTQLHLSVNSDLAGIQEMFKLLSATGKTIRVSELHVDLSAEPTLETLEQQADLYKYVLDTYAAEVPAAQRYGVTVWGPTDAGSWQGLWNSKYTRKPAYALFADGLSEMN